MKLDAAEMVYGKEESQELRRQLIELRDEALNSSSPDFKKVILLSHTVAWIHAAIEKLGLE